jgi:hypothetical protein
MAAGAAGILIRRYDAPAAAAAAGRHAALSTRALVQAGGDAEQKGPPVS